MFFKHEIGFFVFCLVVCTLFSTTAYSASYRILQLTTNGVDDYACLMERDAYDKLHIAYSRDGTVYYRRHLLIGAAETEEVEVCPGVLSSLRVDTGGNPHILSVAGSNVYYAVSEAGSWNSSVVLTGKQACLDIGSTGDIHVAYQRADHDSDSYNEILHAVIQTGRVLYSEVIYDGYHTTVGYGQSAVSEDHDYSNPVLCCGPSNSIHMLATYQVDRTGYYNPEDSGWLCYYRNRNGTTFRSQSGESYYNFMKGDQRCAAVDSGDVMKAVYYDGYGPYYSTNIAEFNGESLFELNLPYGMDASCLDISPADQVGANLYRKNYGPNLFLYRRTGDVFDAGILVTSAYAYAYSDLSVEDGSIVAALEVDGNQEIFLFSRFDEDEDGMMDEWERRHGLSSTNALDADQDADGDHYSNWEEYVADTDPLNETNCLCVQAVRNGRTNLLAITSSEHRLYDVLCCTNLVTGDWNICRDAVMGNGGELQCAVSNIDHQAIYRFRCSVP